MLPADPFRQILHLRDGCMDFYIRTAEPGDEKALADISRLAMSPPWSEKNFIDALHNKYATVLLCASDRMPDIAGYAVCYHAAGEAELPQIAVHPMYRRQGIGKRLLEDLFLRLDRGRIDKLFLEVRQSNGSAQALYERMGFFAVGERKNFYSDPSEDALVMLRKI